MPIFARALLVFGALVAGATVNSAHAATWTETVRWNFVPPEATNDQFGYRPVMGVLSVNGDLYGSASAGGKNGGGVIYRFANGKMHALFSFSDQTPEDPDDLQNWCGFNPSARLVRDSGGALYGTTYEGGPDDGGVAFELKKNPNGNWKCHILWSFKKKTNNTNQRGYASFGGLVADPGAANTFYGVTQFSESISNGGVHTPTGGVVFKLAKSGSKWSYTILHQFRPGAASNGLVPSGPLTLDGGATLYGATFFGGANDGGVIYKINTDGTGFTVLHRFNGNVNKDGAKSGFQPEGPLVVDNGVVYGATAAGGAAAAEDQSGGGVIFRLSAGGNLKVLYSFDNVNTPENGFGPTGGVTMGSDGFLYGNTQFGGANDGGSVFRYKNPSGAPDKDNFQLLYDFPDEELGFRPSGPLRVSGSGTILGTTSAGGSDHGGTIFRLTPP